MVAIGSGSQAIARGGYGDGGPVARASGCALGPGGAGVLAGVDGAATRSCGEFGAVGAGGDGSPAARASGCALGPGGAGVLAGVDGAAVGYCGEFGAVSAGGDGGPVNRISGIAFIFAGGLLP